MDCPFCGKEMKEGIIPSGSKWVEDGLDAWEGIPLTVGLLGKVPKSFYCPDCRQIVLPVPEKAEGVIDTMERRLSAVGDKIEAAREQWEARRDEAKDEKRKKNLGQKDPWEL